MDERRRFLDTVPMNTMHSSLAEATPVGGASALRMEPQLVRLAQIHYWVDAFLGNAFFALSELGKLNEKVHLT